MGLKCTKCTILPRGLTGDWIRRCVLRADKKRELVDTYAAPNPATLLRQIRQSVEQLHALAER